jgi:hypothetical protein
VRKHAFKFNLWRYIVNAAEEVNSGAATAEEVSAGMYYKPNPFSPP